MDVQSTGTYAIMYKCASVASTSAPFALAEQLAGSPTKRVLRKLDQETGNHNHSIFKMKKGNHSKSLGGSPL